MIHASKCRKFDYLKICKKMFKSSIRKMFFSINHLVKVFIFFSLGVIFSKLFDGIKGKAPKHQIR